MSLSCGVLSGPRSTSDGQDDDGELADVRSFAVKRCDCVADQQQQQRRVRSVGW